MRTVEGLPYHIDYTKGIVLGDIRFVKNFQGITPSQGVKWDTGVYKRCVSDIYVAVTREAGEIGL